MHLYDEAIINKFNELFDQQVFIIPPERAHEVQAQLNKDDVKFPLISLDRRGFTIRKSDMNWSSTIMGVPDSISSDNLANIMHIIPISIEYQLDVYTIDRVSCDEILRELIFYFTLHPTLMVKIPYGLDNEHHFNLFFNDNIEDNSDTVEHVNKGVLYRYTATLYTDDAYLFANTPEKLVFSTVSQQPVIFKN